MSTAPSSTWFPDQAGSTDVLLRSIVETVPDCSDASVIVLRRGQASIEGATRLAARAADAAQLTADSGPSLTAIRTNMTTVFAPIIRGPGRFEEFKVAASEVGFGTCIAVPLRTDLRTSAAVTFYGPGSAELDLSGLDDSVLGLLASALAGRPVLTSE